MLWLGTPEWRLWPSIIFVALGMVFITQGEASGEYLLGIAFLSMAILSFWVLKPDMSNPVSKGGVGRRMLEKSRAPNQEKSRAPNQQRLDIPEPVRQMEEKKPD